MAKKDKKEAAAVASFAPQDLSAGLKDDFRGRVVGAEFTAWDYEGNRTDEDGNPIITLAVKASIEELDPETGKSLGEEPFDQYWSAGDIDSFVPGDEDGDPAGEGEDPRDADAEVKFVVGEGGTHACKVGRRSALSRNSNFGRLVVSIQESDEEGVVTFTPNIEETLVGLDAHFMREQQEKRKNLDDDDSPKREVLIVTEVHGFGEAEEKPKAKKGKGKPAPAEEEEPDADEPENLDDKLVALITEAVAKGPVPRPRLSTVLNGLDKKEKAEGVKKVLNTKWLQEQGFTIEKGKVSLDD